MEVCVKKEGSVFTVFMDTVTDRPMPMKSFEDTPHGGFPRVFLSEKEIKQTFPTASLKVFENAPTVPTQAPTIQRPALSIAERGGDSSAQAKALTEFRILLAQYHANPSNDSSKLAVEAVGNFILSLWPSLEEKLSAISLEHKERKFKL